jgi:hypothetical protein
MRVRCDQLLTDRGEIWRESDTLSGITRGREYLVISMMIDRDRRRHQAGVWLHVLDDDERPQWITSLMCSTVDPTLPSNWVAVIRDGEPMLVGPAPWLEPGFWDAFYNDKEPSAIRAAHDSFKDELRKIRAESG